ncbi:MAG TPA: hypothetical protein VGE98_09260 [Thermoanaerobaculia bacterium]
MKDEDLLEDLHGALEGDEACCRRLVVALTPTIQSRVARTLRLCCGGRTAGRTRQQVEDLVQDIFCHLFANDGKVLRSWRPELGLSLVNFVGLVAKRQTLSVLRSPRRSPLTEDPTDPDDLDGPSGAASPEREVASREQLSLLLKKLREKLSDLGWTMFDLLFIQELDVDEVVQRTGQTPDAVYAWRSRLRQLARSLWDPSDPSETE